MGKRNMNYQFVNPCFDEKWLNTEYDIVEYVTDKPSIIENLRQKLTHIRDIEKIMRQLVSKRLYPNSIYHLHTSFSFMRDIHNTLIDEKSIIDYVSGTYTKIIK